MGKTIRREGLALLITLLVGFLGFYIFLPPLSLQSREFYFFAGALMVVWFLVRVPTVSVHVEEADLQGRKKEDLFLFPAVYHRVVGSAVLAVQHFVVDDL